MNIFLNIGMIERFGNVVLTPMPNIWGTAVEEMENNNAWMGSEISLILLCKSDRKFIFSILPILCTMSGIQISSECQKQIRDFKENLMNFPSKPWGIPQSGLPPNFEFVITDIEDIIPVVKRMHLLDLCEGMFLHIYICYIFLSHEYIFLIDFILYLCRSDWSVLVWR
jgi:hypothetical protein